MKENFVKVGMCADIALHDKNDGNAHILLTMRPLNEDTTWGEKSIQWIGTNKTKQKNGERHGQILQTNIWKKITYKKKLTIVPIKDKA